MLPISQPLECPRPRAGAFAKWCLLPLIVGLAGVPTAYGADLDAAQDHFLSGNYAESIHLAGSAVHGDNSTERWHALLIRGMLMTGQYPQALTAATNALATYPRSAVLQWLNREALLQNGETEAATARAREIAIRAMTNPRSYRDPRSLVVVGRALLLQGVDPKQILERLFDVAGKADPTEREVYLASGDLALQKHDYALAARLFQDGLKQLPDDPDLQFGLARAYAPSEPVLAREALEAALKRNSNHVGSLLLLVDRKINAEAHDDATKLLDAVQAVNPAHPEAWAYRMVIAHLRNQPDVKRAAREQALKFWSTNPRVDHLVGLKLSQNYRFQEGARHQEQALKFDATYQPALLQLAQDWLRLGHEEEGWRLADQVQDMDEYDVTANNLVALQGVIEEFQTLTNDHFILRMEPHEARVYGVRALALLEQARTQLCGHYGFELQQPTTVEIFHRRSDFAVRTFGMPEAGGFLGVCFGHVITANSPASQQGQSFNWESMLWHEFCHVVTLQLTGNKIPRWLSEGISVYEERQANPSWGEQLTPDYREMLLDDSLTPVSELSAAFMTPRSSLHLQFAYYQSSLVVEFLVQQYGQATLVALLEELGKGTPINEALELHAAPIETLETAFVGFAHQTAHSLGPGLDWQKPDLQSLMSGSRTNRTEGETGLNLADYRISQTGSTNSWESWARSHPTNFWVMTRTAQELMREEKWAEAQPVLEQLVERFPGFVGPSSTYLMLARTHQALGDTHAEQRTLAEFATREDEATDAYLRLMELVTAEEDWPSAIENARRYLAVDPLVAPPYRYLARASEAMGHSAHAIEAYRALLELDPVNPAELHFRLAKLLYESGDPAAGRHLLQALEDAPRYREALDLLLERHTTEDNERRSAGADPES